MKLRTIFCVMVVGSVALIGCSDSSTTTPPLDTTPPLAPIILNASYANGYLGVWWESNIEPDLAGYNVYQIKDIKPVRLNQFLLHGQTMTAVQVETGTVHVYVTAVDFSGNESAPSSTKHAHVWRDSPGSNGGQGKKNRESL